MREGGGKEGDGRDVANPATHRETLLLTQTL